MKAIYHNRYNDKITFDHKGKTVTMSGYSPYFRYGWPNKYDVAYDKYFESAVVDAKLKGNQILTQEEFEKALYIDKGDDSNWHKNALYQLFGKYIYSDKDTIDMVDPSGGPYLSTGMNLKNFFGKDYEDLMIESIKIVKNKINFKVILAI
jgi:hypothetical protein